MSKSSLKEYFKSLLGNPPEITSKTIQTIIYEQLGQFTKEELDAILKKWNNRKAAGLKTSWSLEKQGNFMLYFSDYAMQFINKRQ